MSELVCFELITYRPRVATTYTFVLRVGHVAIRTADRGQLQPVPPVHALLPHLAVR